MRENIETLIGLLVVVSAQIGLWYIVVVIVHAIVDHLAAIATGS
jgi:hypothetical protein